MNNSYITDLGDIPCPTTRIPTLEEETVSCSVVLVRRDGKVDLIENTYGDFETSNYYQYKSLQDLIENGAYFEDADFEVTKFTKRLLDCIQESNPEIVAIYIFGM